MQQLNNACARKYGIVSNWEPWRFQNTSHSLLPASSSKSIIIYQGNHKFKTMEDQAGSLRFCMLLEKPRDWLWLHVRKGYDATAKQNMIGSQLRVYLEKWKKITIK